jgi:hypothetical protein
MPKRYIRWAVFLGLSVIALSFALAVSRGNRNPFAVTVVGRTNDVSGTMWLSLLISNKTQQTLHAYAACQTLTDGLWTSLNVIDVETGLPVPLYFSPLRPKGTMECVVSVEENLERWRVVVVRHRALGRVQRFVIGICEKLGLGYSVQQEAEQIVESNG